MGERSNIMLARPFEEKRLLKWKPPYLIQPKLDGDRCRVKWHSKEGWVLYSSEDNLKVSVPHIVDALNLSDVPKNLELDGELYHHDSDHDQIRSIIGRTRNLHPDSEKIQFHAFDIISPEPQLERIKDLYQTLDLLPKEIFKKVPTKPADNFDQVMNIYKSYLDSNYEGMIVRNCDAPYLRCGSTQRRSLYLMKFKPKKSDLYKIVGYNQMIDKDGNLKERLGSLICVGQDGFEFSVGSGMNDLFRVQNWPPDNLIGLYLRVEYQHITSGKGVPRFPIFLNIEEGEPEIELF